MYCTKCGRKNEDEANFCASCGEKLNKDLQQTIQEEPKEEIIQQPPKEEVKEQTIQEQLKEEAPKKEIKEEIINEVKEKSGEIKVEVDKIIEPTVPNSEIIKEPKVLVEENGIIPSGKKEKQPLTPEKKKKIFIIAGIALIIFALLMIVPKIGMDRRSIEEVYGVAVKSNGTTLPSDPPSKIGDKLAAYDLTNNAWKKECISSSKQADVAGEVGGIVIINSYKNKVGTYVTSSGLTIGTAYKWVVRIEIVNPLTWETLAQTSLTGGSPPQTSSGSATGTMPSDESIKEWIDSVWPITTTSTAN